MEWREVAPKRIHHLYMYIHSSLLERYDKINEELKKAGKERQEKSGELLL